MASVGLGTEKEAGLLGTGVGIGLIVCGLIFNEWVIAGIASPDGDIELTSARALIWSVDSLLVLIGAFIIRQPHYGKDALLCVMPILSLALCSFILFTVLEVFPSLIFHMPFGYANYYEQRVRHIPDDELIYKNRPWSRFQTESFRGDSYRESYGVDVKPMSYNASYDEYGFRNTSMSKVGEGVVVLGDSYIEFGHDEDDTFSSRLAVLTGLPTRNLGVGGYGPFQYVTVLKRYGLTLKPRYVLFCFFEGNDIGDIRLYVQWKATNVYPYSNLTGKSFLQRYVIAVSDVVLVPLVRTLEGAKGFPENLVHLRVGDEDIKAIFRYKIETRSPDELLKLNEWNILKDVLGEFKAICVQNDIVPMVLFLPTKAHIYAEYSTPDSGTKWLTIKDQQIAAKDHVETALRALCLEIGIDLITVSPAFERAASQGKVLYYPFDSHWNTEGRQLAASVVAERLHSGNATN